MKWSDLCLDNVVTGKAVKLQTICGPTVDHNKRGKTNLPAATTLLAMVNQACKLSLISGLGSGIKFHVALCAVSNQGMTITSKLNKHQKEKTGSAVCYEDMVLPIEMTPGHILVHQSVAPCKRCRAGYKAWAQSRQCSIIVSADEGYDQSGDNKVFIFCPTGMVFVG